MNMQLVYYSYTRLSYRLPTIKNHHQEHNPTFFLLEYC